MYLHCHKRLHCIPLKIHQYRVIKIYKPGPHLFIADWLSRQNHKDNKITGMKININAADPETSTPNGIPILEIQ